MATELKSLDQLLKELPPESEGEVRDFIEGLIHRRQRKSNGHLRQRWGGALEKYRDQFTALDLQKKSLDWRGD